MLPAAGGSAGAERTVEGVRAEMTQLTAKAAATFQQMATRQDAALQLGASTRAAIALIHGAQACALLAGRDYIVPEDVQHMAVQVLAHRLVLSPEARMKGVTPESVVRRIVQNTPVPVKL